MKEVDKFLSSYSYAQPMTGGYELWGYLRRSKTISRVLKHSHHASIYRNSKCGRVHINSAFIMKRGANMRVWLQLTLLQTLS